jgi:hypothetical protein
MGRYSISAKAVRAAAAAVIVIAVAFFGAQVARPVVRHELAASDVVTIGG